MPKNIYLIKENLAKTEEIREIKNEIPTYEEFVKSYEKEQVNYDDLVNEDLGTIKDYDPCNWNNPRFSCQYGENWVNLREPCPTAGCNNMTITNLTHTTGCGGNLEISNKARIQCKGCGSVSNMRNWIITCSNRSFHQGSYNSTSTEKWIDVITVAGRAWNNESLVFDLITYLMNPANRW